MKNGNRLQLEIVPIGGADKDISCQKCPSACCRAGMAIPLNRQEAHTLEDAGTDIREVSKREHPPRAGLGRKFFQLMSDCGNLVTDPSSGETSCAIWREDNYPKACARFKEGGYNCVDTQLSRITADEDSSIYK